MSNFANTLFSSLLGWLRSAAAWLWGFLSDPESGGVIVWIADNWLPLIVLLCAVCMFIDFIVYLIRWQPYKVWASFFRRLFGRGEENDETGRVRRRWIHADGTTSVEIVDVADIPEEPLEPQAFVMQPDMDMPVDPYARFARPETVQPSPSSDEETVSPETFERPQRTEERRRLFPEASEELPLRYAPPPAASDEAPAYHEPYYPPQWKRPADTGSSGVDIGGTGL